MNTTEKINRLLEISKTFPGLKLEEELASLGSKIDNSHLYVAVVGIFKRGKSSIVNALLQQDIVPISVLPLTSIITIIKFGLPQYADVFFNDGHSAEISLTALPEFVTETHNAENHKAVGYVVIYCDAPLLKDITLIDTPGVGSAFEHNSEETLRFIPRIDVALFVLSTDMPVSQMDIDFLQQLQKYVTSFLFVENKADLLAAEELQPVIRHNQEVIHKVLHTTGDLPEIIPVSARQLVTGKQFVSGIDKLHEHLAKTIIAQKNIILANGVQAKLRIYTKQLALLLENRIAGLQSSVSDLEAKLKNLKKNEAIILQKQDKFLADIAYEVNQRQQYLADYVHDVFKTMLTNVEDIIKAFPGNTTGRKEQQGIQNTLNIYIIKVSEQIKKSLEEDTKANFNFILREYEKQAGSFLQTVSRNLAAYLHTDLALFAAKFDLEAYSASYLTLDGMERAVYFPGGIYTLLLPKSKKNQIITRRIYERYRNILISNEASIVYDINYRSQESLRKFNSYFKASLQQLLQAVAFELSGVLANKKEADDISGKRIRESQQQLTVINELFN